MASHDEDLADMSVSVGGTKIRKNWTFGETQVLSNMAIAKRQHVRGQFKGSDAVAKREKAWDEIVAAVNAVSIVNRDRQACETRLRCFPHTVKKAVAAEEHENSKTGGGPPAVPSYQPELVQLALNWLDVTTLEGCAGGGESSLQPEDEEEVESLRLAHKNASLERKKKIQESIDKSASSLVESVPSMQTYLNPPKHRPIIVDTEDESTPATTPMKCAIRRPRVTRTTNVPGPDLTVVVHSIDSLRNVVEDSDNSIRLAILTAARDFMGHQRGATIVDTQVGSDVPMEDRTAEVTTQVNPEDLDQEKPQSKKNERALKNLMKVLAGPISALRAIRAKGARVDRVKTDELPKVSQVSWQQIIGDAMKYSLKNLADEEKNFNIFMDLVGDEGQTDVMKFFEEKAPAILKFSPSDVRFKVMVLFFQFMVDNSILALPEPPKSASRGSQFTRPPKTKRTIDFRDDPPPSTSTSTAAEPTSTLTPVEEENTLCLQLLNEPSPEKDIETEPLTTRTRKSAKSDKGSQLKAKAANSAPTKKRGKRTTRKK